jgi:hypothetical protein
MCSLGWSKQNGQVTSRDTRSKVLWHKFVSNNTISEIVNDSESHAYAEDKTTIILQKYHIIAEIVKRKLPFNQKKSENVKEHTSSFLSNKLPIHRCIERK